MEMEDLSPTARQKRTLPKGAALKTTDGLRGDHDELETDNTIVIWAYAMATWLALLSLLLLAFPRALLFLSSASGREHRDYLTPLENFLSTHFGILLLSLAVGILVSIPPDAPDGRRQGTSIHPLLFPITCGLLLASFLSYNTPASQVGSLALLVAFGTGSTGIWGVWILLFAGSSLRSRKTGADKRTSRFLFWNRSAASVQKKRWAKEQRTR